MKTSPKLHSVKSTSLAPAKHIAQKYPKMCPMFPATMTTFMLDNVNAHISNALARAIGGEMPTKILDCELSDIATDDEFIIHEMVRSRLRMLPLQQSCKIGAKFTLNVTNSGLELIDVKSSELQGAFLAFNQNVTLFTLKANKYCKINAHVIETYGYIAEYGQAVQGVNVASIPQDMAVCESSTSTSNVTEWMIKFTNNGTAKPPTIISAAIAHIIDRLQAITWQFVTENDMAIAYIYNESETIGAMLLKEIIKQNPDIEYVTVNESSRRSLRVRMVAANPDKVLEFAIKSLKDIFTHLAA
jgi:DNA-directed RNA polymerase subunit L